jgi:hypothetical protein
MPSPSDLRRAARLAQSAAAAAVKTSELAMASGEVIARRAVMGADALTNPSIESTTEAMTMISEKGFAAARSSLAAAKAMSDLSTRSATLALSEAQLLSRAVAQAARCETPMELAVVQSEYACKAFGRMMSQGLAWASLAATAGAASMAPFHSAATANARRLSRR